ncbi:hypothetical protein FRIGORI9N_40056 [Frigoribacterium sp. 9N]|nr:hypothetical protein FRIGORI9N_40056 [Frigoribacterium sp. 9N]
MLPTTVPVASWSTQSRRRGVGESRPARVRSAAARKARRSARASASAGSMGTRGMDAILPGGSAGSSGQKMSFGGGGRTLSALSIPPGRATANQNEPHGGVARADTDLASRDAVRRPAHRVRRVRRRLRRDARRRPRQARGEPPRRHPLPARDGVARGVAGRASGSTRPHHGHLCAHGGDGVRTRRRGRADRGRPGGLGHRQHGRPAHRGARQRRGGESSGQGRARFVVIVCPEALVTARRRA